MIPRHHISCRIPHIQRRTFRKSALLSSLGQIYRDPGPKQLEGN